MTDSLDELADFPNRVGFKNFTWTHQAISDWEKVWDTLWHLGAKWEWQNIDKYARRRGKEYDRFIVHNDAYRLDMAIPLPEVHTVKKIGNWLLGAHIDDNVASEAARLIREWINKYVE
jgi:hypothetical protein